MAYICYNQQEQKKHLAYKIVKKLSYQLLPWVLFTKPLLA